ncbi:hypothetical protein Pelo_17279 [Pelomyxa schiedti]|nr:hypothetical protein Pelo_17279 [Pelomyxa schiedti]
MACFLIDVDHTERRTHSVHDAQPFCATKDSIDVLETFSVSQQYLPFFSFLLTTGGKLAMSVMPFRSCGNNTLQDSLHHSFTNETYLYETVASAWDLIRTYLDRIWTQHEKCLQLQLLQHPHSHHQIVLWSALFSGNAEWGYRRGSSLPAPVVIVYGGGQSAGGCLVCLPHLCLGLMEESTRPPAQFPPELRLRKPTRRVLLIFLPSFPQWLVTPSILTPVAGMIP